MATVLKGATKRPRSIAADGFEKVLAVAAAILLGFVITALARGYMRWGEVQPLIWVHLALMIVALALTPIMLLRRRGDRPHRVLGTVWIAAMLASALITFGIRNANHGGFSFIHLLSVWVSLHVPYIWWTARTHRIDLHRSGIRGMVTGALLIAGFFTFPFNRLLGQFLFG